MGKLDDIKSYLEEVHLDPPAVGVPVVTALPSEVQEFSIVLPWGTRLTTHVGTDIDDCQAWVGRLTGPLTAVMGSIQPMFIVVDVMQALSDSITSVVECVTSFSAQPLVDSLQKLSQAVTTMMCSLYPPFAWPAMIISIIDFLIRVTNCLISNVDAMCEASARIANAEALISVDPRMSSAAANLAQAKANLSAQVKNLIGSVSGLSDLLSLVNTFIEIINDLASSEVIAPIEIAEFSQNSTCEDMLVVLHTLNDTLTSVTAVIPECP